MAGGFDAAEGVEGGVWGGVDGGVGGGIGCRVCGVGIDGELGCGGVTQAVINADNNSTASRRVIGSREGGVGMAGSSSVAGWTAAAGASSVYDDGWNRWR